MPKSHNWVCPVCRSHTTLTSPNYTTGTLISNCEVTPEGRTIGIYTTHIECPNVECGAQFFEVAASHGTRKVSTNSGRYFIEDKTPVGIGKFTFLPTTATPLSGFVPKQVSDDYAEASLISGLSPKASATLARRALQGMVRDYFQVSGKRTLHAELEAIKDRCDSALYDAMMAVKSVGNIGAHPEQDINLIVDVEPGEADTLLQLIHLLDREWYVARADRQARISKMMLLGASKDAAKTLARAKD